MRFGSTPTDAVERLRTAFERRIGAKNLGTIPRLEIAVEFGAARDWGLTLASDLEDYRAGSLSWDKIDRGAIVYSDPGLRQMFAGGLDRTGMPDSFGSYVSRRILRGKRNCQVVLNARSRSPGATLRAG